MTNLDLKKLSTILSPQSKFLVLQINLSPRVTKKGCYCLHFTKMSSAYFTVEKNMKKSCAAIKSIFHSNFQSHNDKQRVPVLLLNIKPLI